MTWTRLSDEFCDRAEVASLTDAAFRAHVEALVYCNRVLTDGRLPKSVVRRVLTRATRMVYVELVKAGLWIEEPEHFTVDWRDQLGADEVEQRRALDRERRERSRRHKSGDHTMCRPSYCPHATRDGMRDAMRGGMRDRTRDGTRDQTRESQRDGRPPVPPDPTRSARPDPPGSRRKGKGNPDARAAPPADADAPHTAPANGRTSPPWCGDCDDDTRLREQDDGRVIRCPTCHPLTQPTG